MHCDLLSFDLDGTLVDTAAEIAEAANRALESSGIARRPVAEIEMLIGAGTHELIRRLLAKCFEAQPELAHRVRPHDVLHSMDQHYTATTGTLAAPYAGCEAALQALAQAGVRLVCVTNKELRHALRVLEVTALAPYFELVMGGDSLSEKKPHASVLRHVARELGVDLARVVHVGDSVTDVEAARNAGVAAWAVSYGYNGGVPIAQAKPDQLFHSLGELAAHALAQRAASLS